MENSQLEIQASPENNACPSPSSFAEDLNPGFIPEYRVNHQKGIPLSWAIAALLALMLVMNLIHQYQDKQYDELVLQEAYLVSAAIYTLEDNFLLAYGIFPEDLGLGYLRNEWLDNPCHESANSYYQALLFEWEHFEDPVPFETFKTFLV